MIFYFLSKPTSRPTYYITNPKSSRLFGTVFEFAVNTHSRSYKATTGMSPMGAYTSRDIRERRRGRVGWPQVREKGERGDG